MGQIGSALGNPNTMAPDPSGFSGSEMAARFMGKGLQGGLQGLQNPQAQRQGGYTPQIQSPQTPMIQPQIYTPGAGVGSQGGMPFSGSGNNGSIWPPDGGPTKRGSNPYFYGYGQ